MAKFIILLSSIASVAAFSFIGTPSSTLCQQAVHSRSRCVSELCKSRERVRCASSCSVRTSCVDVVRVYVGLIDTRGYEHYEQFLFHLQWLLLKVLLAALS